MLFGSCALPCVCWLFVVAGLLGLCGLLGVAWPAATLLGAWVPAGVAALPDACEVVVEGLAFTFWLELFCWELPGLPCQFLFFCLLLYPP